MTRAGDLPYEPPPTGGGYVLTFPAPGGVGDGALALPLSLRPQGVGAPRNVRLVQAPYSESPHVRGDGRRVAAPLVLVGELTEADLPEPSEAAVVATLSALDAAARVATAIERAGVRRRSLFPLGYLTTGQPMDVLTWPLTVTLFPTGPDWLHVQTGVASPF